ncbi:MAG: bifunctional nicotinamidase/pyrazinamidase [Planctomycetota bacterium]
MNTALVVVDVQNDFCSGGPLAVPDAEGVVPVANALMERFRHVILTQDWHPPGHVSFASSHSGRRVHARLPTPFGEQILWPDHCVADTTGAALHAGLRVPAAAAVLRKGVHHGADAYSAFFENDGLTPVGLDAMLRVRSVRTIVLAGLATDYCVLHTALDARRLGYEVTVIEAGCRGIDLDGSLAEAWKRMALAGVQRDWPAEEDVARRLG